MCYQPGLSRKYLKTKIQKLFWHLTNPYFMVLMTIKFAKLTMMLVVNAARDTIVEQAWPTGCNKKTTQSS